MLPRIPWLLATSLLACSTSTKPKSTSTATDEGDHRTSKLQPLVAAALPELHHDPCTAAMLWALRPEASAGSALDGLLDSERNQPCEETIAAARVLRLGRLGSLDLTGELAQTSSIARAVAIRYAVAARLPGAEAAIAAAVQREVGAVGDVASRAHAVLGKKAVPVEQAPGLLLSEAKPAGRDRCAEAQADLRTADRTAAALTALLTDHFRRLAITLDRIGAASAYGQRCRLPADTVDALLGGASPALVRGLAAAILLYRRHGSIGDRSVTSPATPAGLQGLSANAFRSCTTDQECDGSSVCFRPAQSPSPAGICGQPLDRGGRRVRVTSRVYYATPCWGIADCPPFFYCSAFGACVRPHPRSSLVR